MGFVKSNDKMSEFKQYQRSQVAELRPYQDGEILPENVSISQADKDAGSPKVGDMIARNPANHNDQLLVAERYFKDNFEATTKTLHNTTASQAKDNVKDIEFWGDSDMFKLICKASSRKEGWMKSTKAMQIADIGCVVQVTTQQGDNVAEALVFVPDASIVEKKDDLGNVVSRALTYSS